MNEPFRDETRTPAVPRPMDVSSFRPLALMAVAVTGVVGCVALGGLTNAVNGYVCPDYFCEVLGLPRLSDFELWRISVAQGILEGTMLGLVLSAIYTAVIGISSGARCPYPFAAAHLSGMLAAALGCWLVGGGMALGLLAFSPEYFRFALQHDYAPIAPFFWVRGSIWGVEFGGMFCLAVGCVLFLARWRRIVRQYQAADFFRRAPHEPSEAASARPGGGEAPAEEITR